jgi:hypothetical protein
MMWFVVLQGLAMAALGIWAVVSTAAPIASSLAVTGFGLAWAGVAFIGIRFEKKSASLREALAVTDPEANRQNKKQKRLLWVQWASFAACLIWIFATARLAGPNEMWSIYGAGVFLAITLIVMLYRAFLTSNLDAAAMRNLNTNFAGSPKKQLLGKSGQGAIVVVLTVVLIAGFAIDEFAHLPFKFGTLFWYGLGLFVIWAVAIVVWSQIRKRLPKRRE